MAKFKQKLTKINIWKTISEEKFQLSNCGLFKCVIFAFYGLDKTNAPSYYRLKQFCWRQTFMRIIMELTEADYFGLNTYLGFDRWGSISCWCTPYSKITLVCLSIIAGNSRNMACKPDVVFISWNFHIWLFNIVKRICLFYRETRLLITVNIVFVHIHLNSYNVCCISAVTWNVTKTFRESEKSCS